MTLSQIHDKALRDKLESTNQDQPGTKTSFRMLICRPTSLPKKYYFSVT